MYVNINQNEIDSFAGKKKIRKITEHPRMCSKQKFTKYLPVFGKEMFPKVVIPSRNMWSQWPNFPYPFYLYFNYSSSVLRAVPFGYHTSSIHLSFMQIGSSSSKAHITSNRKLEATHNNYLTSI